MICGEVSTERMWFPVPHLNFSYEEQCGDSFQKVRHAAKAIVFSLSSVIRSAPDVLWTLSIPYRHSLSRLCAVHISFHSLPHASRPRRMNLLNPSTSLMCPNIGSMVMCPAPDLMDSIKRRYTGDQRGAAEDGQILHAGFQA